MGKFLGFLYKYRTHVWYPIQIKSPPTLGVRCRMVKLRRLFFISNLFFYYTQSSRFWRVFETQQADSLFSSFSFFFISHLHTRLYYSTSKRTFSLKFLFLSSHILARSYGFKAMQPGLDSCHPHLWTFDGIDCGELSKVPQDRLSLQSKPTI